MSASRFCRDCGARRRPIPGNPYGSRACPDCRPEVFEQRAVTDGGQPTGIYLAGPVERDDDPRTWRDAVKAQFPGVEFVDPMDWQDGWESDPAATVQRELRAVEENAVLACNIGSDAPETVGTHHEISHALAHGNERIAVVPEGDVAGFIQHRQVRQFDRVEDAVEFLLAEELVTDGGTVESGMGRLLEEIDLPDGWVIEDREQDHLSLDYRAIPRSRLERRSWPGVDVSRFSVWMIASHDNIGDGFDRDHAGIVNHGKTVDCVNFDDAVDALNHAITRVEQSVGEELREAHRQPYYCDGGDAR